MKPISDDWRTRIVHVYEETDVSYSKVATRFQVSESSVRRVVKQWREQGTVAPQPHGGGHPSKLDAAGVALVTELATTQVDATQDEMRGMVAEQTGIPVSQPTICRILHRSTVTRKKNATGGRTGTGGCESRSQDLCDRPEDASRGGHHCGRWNGGVTGMSRLYGYAPRGERAFSSEPAEKGTRLNVIGALSIDGFLGGWEVTGSVNGDVFEAFLEGIVVPHLCPGKVVLLDNVRFHHRESIREIIEAKGASALFLPAYSPEFNPIEECWSKLKAWIRKRAPRTVEALQDAITEAIHQVTRNDSEGWFRHAGYLFNANE